ncbi:MAG: polyphosphate kinase 2 [Urechidicola sp.]|nr:polyphosphate kinase 2 [Urechidicola sp.]
MTQVSKNKVEFTKEDFQATVNPEELVALANSKKINIISVLSIVQYNEELRSLQVELVKLQRWILKNKKRVAIIFEGRDAAGKGGNIRRYSEHLNPRSMRTVALTKPTEIERGQWYFERYIKELPNPGEIVFFDRSWYNRAVVEPVMGFCTDEQYKRFMSQVSEFEHMLYEDGIVIVKFWFSINKEEQQKRFNARLDNPLKRWKFSPVDEKGQKLWDVYTSYKDKMFSSTHTTYSPWITVKANDKKSARLESMRYVLSKFDYDGKDDSKTTLYPDPNIVMRYFRSNTQIDS